MITIDHKDGLPRYARSDDFCHCEECNDVAIHEKKTWQSKKQFKLKEKI